MKIIDVPFEHSDERGIFRELARGDKWKEINVAERKKGITSGNHYHKVKDELFYVYRGRCHLRVLNFKTGKEDNYDFKENDMFVLEPYEMHEFSYSEDTLFVILLSLAFEQGNSDTYTL